MIILNEIKICLMLAIFTPNIKIYVSQDIRHDQQQLIGSDVALTCDLVEEYGNQVKWRKFNGVSLIFLIIFSKLNLKEN